MFIIVTRRWKLLSENNAREGYRVIGMELLGDMKERAIVFHGIVARSGLSERFQVIVGA